MTVKLRLTLRAPDIPARVQQILSGPPEQDVELDSETLIYLVAWCRFHNIDVEFITYNGAGVNVEQMFRVALDYGWETRAFKDGQSHLDASCLIEKCREVHNGTRPATND